MAYLYDMYFSTLNVLINTGDFFSIRPENTWQIDRHRTYINKFYYITKGSCTIWIEGKEYVGTAGSWFFIPAQTEHSYYNHKDGDFEKFWTHFELQPSDTNLFDLLSLPYHIEVGHNREIKQLFKRLTSTFEGSLSDRLSAKACLLQLLAKYITASAAEEVSIKSQTDNQIDLVLHYINNHLQEPIYNADLSKLCHMHPNHFIRFFKEKVGKTPSRYINTQKLEFAKQLLKDSDMTIAEISEKYGFTDVSYFSKQFKEFYNMSPRVYRQLSRLNRH